MQNILSSGFNTGKWLLSYKLPGSRSFCHSSRVSTDLEPSSSPRLAKQEMLCQAAKCPGRCNQATVPTCLILHGTHQLQWESHPFQSTAVLRTTSITIYLVLPPHLNILLCLYVFIHCIEILTTARLHLPSSLSVPVINLITQYLCSRGSQNANNHSYTEVVSLSLSSTKCSINTLQLFCKCSLGTHSYVYCLSLWFDDFRSSSFALRKTWT